MDINHPRFEEYQTRFEALADMVVTQKGAQPELASAKMMLCLYGDNGLSPEDEFAQLEKLEDHLGQGLKHLEMATNYWHDVILYVL